MEIEIAKVNLNPESIFILLILGFYISSGVCIYMPLKVSFKKNSCQNFIIEFFCRSIEVKEYAFRSGSFSFIFLFF